MNGKDIFLGLKYVGEDLIEEAEYGVFPASKQKSGGTKRGFRRPLLVAALIAMMLLLVGCAVVYVLKMERLKIAEATSQRAYSLVDGIYVEDPHTVNTSTLTLAGLEGSNAYKANKEYYTYKRERREELLQMGVQGKLPKGYWSSTAYQDDLNRKAQELAEQYGLKPEGSLLEFRTVRNLCDALCVERFVRESEFISADIIGGACYDSGNFQLSIDFRFPDDQGYEVISTNGTLHWNRTDSFSRDYVTIEESGDWSEWNYITKSGTEVLILYSPSQEASYIICDRGEALMSLEIVGNIELLSEIDGVVSAEYKRMTKQQLEMVADTIDFSIQPRIVTQEDVVDQPEAPISATQNGYTLTLKSVETDGYVVRILIGVTAPEGTDIEEMNIGVGDDVFTSESVGTSGYSGAFNGVEDYDEVANTKDLLLVRDMTSIDGGIVFAEGTVWNLTIIDLWVDKYWETEQILAEGEWNFSITFDKSNSDYREIELLAKPILADACVGWKMDGTDVLDEFTVTSFKLRKFSSEIKWELRSYMGDDQYGKSADFYSWRDHQTYAVMKDGTEIQMGERNNYEPIDLNQVNYVVLADGTKLMIPQN